MEQIVYIEMEDVLRFEHNAVSFGNELVIVTIDGSQPREQVEEISVKLKALSFLLITRGTLDITIDNKPISLSENFLIDIMERHTVKNFRISPDFKGYHLLASSNILSETLLNSRRPPISSIATVREYPIHRISAKEAALLETNIQRIQQSIVQTDHSWQRELVMNDLRGFFIEMKNIVFKLNKEEKKEQLPSRDELFFLFIQLLDKHCREEHSVAFYAGELCVTPEYLSSVMKNRTGRTVTKWIGDALLRQAQTFLRSRDHTIQQISDLLHFSDQSAFGKFFKKNCGMSPLQYRRIQ